MIVSMDSLPNSGGISGRHNFGGVNCTECHTGSAYAGGSIQWTNGGNVNNTADNSIPVGVPTNYGVKQVSGGTAPVEIGFNLAARLTTVGNAKISGISPSGNAQTIVTNEATHTGPQAPGYVFTWSFTPPAIQDFRFYSCINRVNGDNTDGAPDGPAICGTRLISVYNTIPVATADSVNINQGGLITNFDVFANDAKTDVDGHTVIFGSFSSGPAGYTTSGSTFSFSTGSTYDYLDSTDPDLTFTVKHTLTDGFTGVSNPDIGFTTITVSGLNDTPTAMASVRSRLQDRKRRSRSRLSRGRGV